MGQANCNSFRNPVGKMVLSHFAIVETEVKKD